MQRTFDEINDKIKNGSAAVLTASEAKELIKDKGLKYFFKNTDIVTCASFEMNTNALLYLHFRQTDPLIYFSEAYINNIYAYPTGPTDLVLSCVAASKENPEYGGANVIEELVARKDVYLKAFGKYLDVFQNKEFTSWFNIRNLNQARLILNQVINQNSIVATNSGDKDLSCNMGTLISHLENSTYNSCSYLNPLVNDPFCKTIGIGSKIWVAGACGLVLGQGSNNNPLQRRNEYNIPVGPGITLSAVADIDSMNPKWIRGGFIKSFGPVLYIGIGVSIPILNEAIAEGIAITDDKIHTTIVDFSIPRRTKPIFGQCTYSELRTSTVLINKKPTLAAPLASMAWAIEICEILKNDILNQRFYLAEPVSSINLQAELKKSDVR